MSIIEIENAIKQLPPDEVNELMDWFTAYHAELWERQIAEDLEEGQFDALLEEIDAEIEAGLAKPLWSISPCHGSGSTIVNFQLRYSDWPIRTISS